MFLPTITDTADVMQLPTVDGMQDMECDMVCAMRYAMDSAMCDEGTAFLPFLSACCHGIAAAMACLIGCRTGPLINT